jgi:two-component system, OmpR family, KDP operon response regulator KdpE
VDRKERILIVDDEAQIARVLRAGLTARGYEVRSASDGALALAALDEWGPDLVVTDLSMPGIDGIELCRRIRARSEVPVIVLSVKGEEQTKVAALDAGADDYVTKPFGMDELLARVRAALRRTAATAAPAANVLEAGDFRIDLEARSVAVRGEAVRLTPKEYELLVFLMRNAGKVLTHRAILSAVWGGNYVEQVEYLRVFVGHLRKKVEADPSKPRHVLTEPWTGYRFDPGG